MRSIFFLLITILFSNLSLFSQTEIHVESEPGVSVYLDTVFKGKTTKNDGGLIIKDVIEGVHTIEVKKEGHLPQTEKITKGEAVFIYKVKKFEPNFDELILDMEEEEEDSPVFFIVEKMPVFMPEKCKDEKEGQILLQKYISENVQYPKEAIKKKIEGRVYLSFVVDTIGKVTDVKVIRGVDPLLDAEAIRVISSLPDFSPGMQKGKPVKVSFTLPISFNLG